MAVDLSALWDFENAPASEARLRSAAESSDDPVERLVLLTQVARALGLQGRYDEAHTALDGVETAPHDAAEVTVRLQLERGRLHRSAGAPAEAGSCFTTASDRAEEAGLDGLRVDALHMLALLPESPHEQAALTRKAIDVARGSGDESARRWEASLLNNLGMAQVDLGELDAALSTFQEALDARRRTGSVRDVQIARWMVGWALRLLGRTDEALTLQRALRAELDAAGEQDPYVDEELALLSASDDGR